MSRRLVRTPTIAIPVGALYAALTPPADHKYEVLEVWANQTFGQVGDLYALATDGVLMWLGHDHQPAGEFTCRLPLDSFPLNAGDTLYLVMNGPSSTHVAGAVVYIDVAF